MIREATVQKIQWGRDDNPWKILKMDDGSGWKGEVGDVVPGTRLRAECGEPEQSRYGLTYTVLEVIGSALEGQDAAEQWITYRLPQVGPERAAAIVKRFCAEVWLVLADPERCLLLCEIPGITEERAREIHKAYLQYSAEQASAVHLRSLGVSMVLAVRAAKKYAADLIDVQTLLERDPYELMDVDGVGFDTADALAQRLGVQFSDPRRARARVRDVLEQDLRQGHCYKLTLEVVVLLGKWGIAASQARSILSESSAFEINNDKIQLADVARAERAVARGVQRLRREIPDEKEKRCSDCHGAGRHRDEDDENDEVWALCHYCGGTGKHEMSLEDDLPEWLDTSQRAAVVGLVCNGLAIMTGGPGTGKTTCLKTAIDQLEARGHTFALAAPTGKAAKRLSEVVGRPASTIHRLLGWSERGWKHYAGNPIPESVVIIDEASMLDVKLAGALFEAVSNHTRLIFVGDVDQLPPVGPGQVLCDLIEAHAVPVHRLETTHRQAGDSWVIDNAKLIINGCVPSLTEASDFDFVELKGSDEIIESVIGAYRMCPEIQVLTPEHKNGAGTVAINGAVQRALNPRGNFDPHAVVENYKIYERDRVLYTKNTCGLVNGDVGVVERVKVSGTKTTVYARFEGVDGSSSEDGCVELEGDNARHLTLAYAMTVHKFQGSQTDYVAVVCDDAHSSLRRQLLYTAVTRTRKNLLLLGSSKAISRAVGRPRDTHRRTLLVQRLNVLANTSITVRP